MHLPTQLQHLCGCHWQPAPPRSPLHTFTPLFPPLHAPPSRVRVCLGHRQRRLQTTRLLFRLVRTHTAAGRSACEAGLDVDDSCHGGGLCSRANECTRVNIMPWLTFVYWPRRSLSTRERSQPRLFVLRREPTKQIRAACCQHCTHRQHMNTVV